jgi:hypothetical protein
MLVSVSAPSRSKLTDLFCKDKCSVEILVFCENFLILLDQHHSLVGVVYNFIPQLLILKNCLFCFLQQKQEFFRSFSKVRNWIFLWHQSPDKEQDNPSPKTRDSMLVGHILLDLIHLSEL